MSTTLWEVKRFMERWSHDARFREELLEDPQGASDRCGLHVDTEALRPFWDPEIRVRLGRGEIALEDLAPVSRQHLQRIQELVTLRGDLRAQAAPLDPLWRAWREQHMERCKGELSQRSADQIIFATAAHELSQGCSVGCWFCGISAPSLRGHFEPSTANRKLFREVLEFLCEHCGVGSMRTQFLYWATDPLDNPDYELFSEDFRAVVGHYPLVTTAIPLRDPERTRRLLRRIREVEKYPRVDRFSVLTLRELQRIHQTFSPDELGWIECVPQNAEGIGLKANAGRFREAAIRNPARLAKEHSKLIGAASSTAGGERALHSSIAEQEHGTIACVAGLLFNWVERSVKLVAPCRASERWPLGYWVLRKERFSSPKDLRDLVRNEFSEQMDTRIPDELLLRLRPGVQCSSTGSSLQIRSAHSGVQIGNPEAEDYIADLQSLILSGNHTASEIARELMHRHGVWSGSTVQTLQGLFDKGLLSVWDDVSESGAPAARASE